MGITMIYSNSSIVSNLMWGFMLLAYCTFFLPPAWDLRLGQT